MNVNDQAGDTGAEHHARQRANAAENEAGIARDQLTEARRSIQKVSKRLEEALACLDLGADEATRDELTAALRELSQLRL